MMPTLICQGRNSDKVILAVKILAPFQVDSKKFGKLNAKPGQFLIRDGDEAWLISDQEFEDTYYVRKEMK